MSSYLEIRGLGGSPWIVSLAESDGPVSIGRGSDNTVSLPDDRRASWWHAVIHPLAGGWFLRDVGSRNGTKVGGQPITGERALRHNDVVFIGQTRITYRTSSGSDMSGTEAGAPSPPEVTGRERDVLVALCRPFLAGEEFPEPPSTRRIADELFVTAAAVEKHLGRLYDKFELPDDGSRRRVRLAREAVVRGAVTPADLSPGA